MRAAATSRHTVTMFLVLLFTLAAGQVALSQDQSLAQKCLGPPPGVNRPQECCKLPAFFPDQDFIECGFQRGDDGTQRNPGPPDCSKQMCMLKKYNLINQDESINPDALRSFFDNWTGTYPHFKEAMEKAKQICVGRPLPGPPQICEANKMVFCVSSTLFSECPVWEQTENCTALKDFMEVCKPYFHRQ